MFPLVPLGAPSTAEILPLAGGWESNLGARNGLQTRHRCGRARAVRRVVAELVPTEPPDIRPWLRERIAWYDETLARVEAGPVFEPGVRDKLEEERGLHAGLLSLLEHEGGSG